MSLAAWIADIGENPNFVAFQAHMWFAFALVYGLKLGMIGVVTILGAAAAKEFYFDIKFEQDPPQTIKDGLLDFAGYASGVVLGVLCQLF